MEYGHSGAQRRHHLAGQGAPPGQAVKQPFLVETVHDDQPVDRVAAGFLARLAQRQRTVAAAPDRRHAEIDFRRELVVDRDLGGAHLGPPHGGREIHVGKLYGALQLVGAHSGQEHDRAVSVDAARRGEMGGKEIDDLRLILDDEGWLAGHRFNRAAGAVRRRSRDRYAG